MLIRSHCPIPGSFMEKTLVFSLNPSLFNKIKLITKKSFNLILRTSNITQVSQTLISVSSLNVFDCFLTILKVYF